jgi:hypothetical protein
LHPEYIFLLAGTPQGTPTSEQQLNELHPCFLQIKKGGLGAGWVIPRRRLMGKNIFKVVTKYEFYLCKLLS